MSDRIKKLPSRRGRVSRCGSIVRRLALPAVALAFQPASCQQDLTDAFSAQLQFTVNNALTSSAQTIIMNLLGL